MACLQSDGIFSSGLKQVKIGEKLKSMGPSGAFTLNDSSLKKHWFISGGTGLAPVLSMLCWLGEMGVMHSTRLYFGVNNERELFASDGLQVHQRMHLNEILRFC